EVALRYAVIRVQITPPRHTAGCQVHSFQAALGTKDVYPLAGNGRRRTWSVVESELVAIVGRATMAPQPLAVGRVQTVEDSVIFFAVKDEHAPADYNRAAPARPHGVFPNPSR